MTTSKSSKREDNRSDTESVIISMARSERRAASIDWVENNKNPPANLK